MSNLDDGEDAVPLFGIFVSMFSSALWGMYPVLTRYVMVREASQPAALSVLAVLMSFNSIVVGSAYLVGKCFGEAEVDDDENRASTSKKMGTALWYGVLCLFRMSTNMQSTRMTKAYNTQMTAMSLPFFTAFLAKFFLAEKIHYALMPALAIMVVGSLLVLDSQGAFDESSSNGESFTHRDLAGILLQLLSVLFSAGVKIAFKSTDGVLDKIELLLSQFFVTAVPLLIYTMNFQWDSLCALFELDTAGWVCMISLAFGIYIIGKSVPTCVFVYLCSLSIDVYTSMSSLHLNLQPPLRYYTHIPPPPHPPTHTHTPTPTGNYTQILAVRSIGAGNHSASNSLRLLAAVIGSALVLNESLSSTEEWLGIGLIIAAISGYWFVKQYNIGGPTTTMISSVAIGASADDSAENDTPPKPKQYVSVALDDSTHNLIHVRQTIENENGDVELSYIDNMTKV